MLAVPYAEAAMCACVRARRTMAYTAHGGAGLVFAAAADDGDDGARRMLLVDVFTRLHPIALLT